jgi:DNA-directed RNA polymerase subunit M/transcription elongation factor TFIIS
MDDEMKKKISIGIAVGCIAIAAVITISTYRSSTGVVNPNAPVPMMCVNPQCGNIFELKQSDVVPKENADTGGETTGPQAFKCPKCNQMSAYVAIKCSKCGNVFLPNYKDITKYDKCPKCGYSAYEQSNKE